MTDQSEPFFGGLESRAEALKRMSPELSADVYLYPTADGGKRLTAEPGCQHETGVRRETHCAPGHNLAEYFVSQ